MTSLNEKRATETSRFLEWLAHELRTEIDELTGKDSLRNYSGDYQQNEAELSFGAFYDVLFRNRGKTAANLSDKAFEARVQREYEASLGVLLPIKEQLAHTDRLIDLIVYKLYGLTEEEIAIVEGRGS
jgi:hypothetical protein